MINVFANNLSLGKNSLRDNS